MKNMYREVFLSSRLQRGAVDFRNPEILEFTSIHFGIQYMVCMKIVMNIWKDIRKTKAIDSTR